MRSERLVALWSRNTVHRVRKDKMGVPEERPQCEAAQVIRPWQETRMHEDTAAVTGRCIH
jgi:hypothetical protein